MESTENEILLDKWRRLYRHTLLENIVPFWMKYGIDKKYGGLNNMIDDDGNTAGNDKYLWSQGRGLWTFSALYNRIEKRKELLDFAHHIYTYIKNRGRDSQGNWNFRLDPQGNVMERNISIYVDGFVINGLTEYFRATADNEALNLALETCESVIEKIQKPGSYGIAPYQLPPGMKPLGVNMIFSFFLFDLGQASFRPDICKKAIDLAKEILTDFYVPEKDAILEFVTIDGKFSDTPEGRTCVPGHVIEAMWFLITIFEQTGQISLIEKCCKLIKRHLELAWDEEYGGLKLALDIDGKQPVYWKNHECKAWWVHVEALVATAFAYLYSKENWCLVWHKKIQDYAFSHFPVPSGEWTQWLDRKGNKIKSPVLPVKDPFHLPRALIYLIQLFETRII